MVAPTSPPPPTASIPEFVARWSPAPPTAAATQRGSISADLRDLAPKLLDARAFAGHPTLPDLLCQTLVSTILAPTPAAREDPRLAIHCLGNLYTRHGARLSPDPVAASLDALRAKLVAAVQAIQDAAHRRAAATNEDRRLVSAALRALQLVLAEARAPPPLDTDSLTNLVDTLNWAIFRAKSNPWLAANTFRTPTLPATYNAAVAASTSPPNNNGLHKNLVVRRMRSMNQLGAGTADSPTPARNSPSPSESEFSDVEAQREPAAKIRHTALALLGTLAKVTGKAMFNHWEKFLPVSGPGLLDIVRDDPSTRFRSLAATAVAALLDGSRTYLTAAGTLALDDGLATAKQARFTSLSEKLARILALVHTACVASLQQDPTALEAAQLVRTFATLASAADYLHRPTAWTAFGTAMANAARTHPDPSVAAAVTASLAGLMDQLGENHMFASALSPWTADWLHLAAAVARPQDDGPWRVLRHLCRDPAVDLDAVRAVVRDAVAGGQKPHATAVVEAIVSSPAAPSDAEEWWTATVDDLIAPVLAAENAADPAGLDAVAAIPVAAFALLPRSRQICIMTAVLAAASAAATEDGESEPAEETSTNSATAAEPVLAAAFRALGVLCTHAAAADDDQFVFDATQAILHAPSAARPLAVRIRASWALANLASHVLLPRVTSRRDEDDEVRALLPSVVSAALHAATKDHEKCRGNGLRALGPAYAALLAANPTRAPMSSVESQVVAALATVIRGPGGAVKPRWNACVAARPVLDQLAVRRETRGKAARKLVDALVAAVVSCNNFKVRIHATTAIAGVAGEGGWVPEVRAIVGAARKAVDKGASGTGGAAAAARLYLGEWVDAVAVTATALLDGCTGEDGEAEVRAEVAALVAALSAAQQQQQQ
ncbi:hypothetical protein H9P43_001894 [Blastocladiella emersonii ATCC 22665]|nr:hypothetical protein H9P43_001894 [Blastocladiella emersonii ATCC 22665]